MIILGVEDKLRPTPWITDGAFYYLQDFIEKRGPELNVLEFGAGSSSVWLAPRVKSLITYEHDNHWLKLADDAICLKDRWRPILMPLPYYTSTFHHQYGPFDLILVDGRNRVECVRHNYKLLAQNGIIMVDNTERVQYEPIREILKDFKSVDFEQPEGQQDITGWVAPHKWITTVFYK